MKTYPLDLNFQIEKTASQLNRELGGGHGGCPFDFSVSQSPKNLRLWIWTFGLTTLPPHYL